MTDLCATVWNPVCETEDIFAQMWQKEMIFTTKPTVHLFAKLHDDHKRNSAIIWYGQLIIYNVHDDFMTKHIDLEKVYRCVFNRDTSTINTLLCIVKVILMKQTY